MSTRYGPVFTDRDGKKAQVDASQIAQRINLEEPGTGQVYLSLNEAEAHNMLWGLRAAFEHNDWDWPW